MYQLDRPVSHRRTLRRIVSIATAAGALFSSPASAHAEEASGGLGVYVSVAFGDRLAVGWGAEVFAIALLNDDLGCRTSEQNGVGGMMQVGMLNLDQLRLVGAATAGGEPERGFGLAGELGVAAHFLKNPGFGVHTGFLLQSSYLVAFARQEWLLNEYSIGGGFRALPTFGVEDFGCSIGRPWRAEDGSVHRVASDDTRPDASPTERIALGRAWQQDAQSECASIPAFLQLAIDLVAHNAPDALVERALRAAEDEVRHTQHCAAVASELVGAEVRPTLPNAQMRPPRPGPDGLARLAVESWQDGWVQEGAAAKRAAWASDKASSAPIRTTLRGIAKDELGHAELARDVLAWSIARGGSDTRELIRSHRDWSPPRSSYQTSAHDLPEHLAMRSGLVGNAASEDIYDQHITAARRELDHMLSD